jgi:hypothetical protein
LSHCTVPVLLIDLRLARMVDYEKNDVTARTLSPAGETVFRTGNLEFVAEQGENGGKTTYQEASGAPVEARSPLPARVQWFTIVFLNIGQMIGTGVFSTRKSYRYVQCRDQS